MRFPETALPPHRWLLAALLLALTGYGAKPELTLARPKAFVGEPVTLSISVAGASDDRPEIAAPVGLSSRFVDRQSQGTAESGTRTVWRFLIVAKRPGKYEIPVSTAGTDEERPSWSTRFEAIAAEATDKMKLETKLSESSCYVGQPIALEVSWLLFEPVQNVRAVDINMPIMAHPDFKMITPADESDAGNQTIGLPVSDTRVIADRRGVRIDKDQWTRVSFRRIIVPRTAGDFDLDPAVLLCSVYRGAASRFQYPSYFNNDFFLTDEDTSEHIRVQANAAPLKLSVKALPTAGRPADFDGLVGSFKLTVTSEVEEVEAGQPVALTLRVSEYPYPEALTLPMLSSLAAFSHRFDCPKTYGAGAIRKGDKIFERIIRPQRADVHEVPPVVVPIFNPVTAAYERVQSEALPLKVLPARKFTAFDAQFADGRELKNKLVPSEAGIGHNRLGAQLLQKQSAVTPLGVRPWLYLTLLLPPLAFVLALLLHSNWCRQLRDPRRHAAREALAAALAACARPAAEPLKLAADIRAFVAVRTGLLPHVHTVDDLAALVVLSPAGQVALTALYAAEAGGRYSDRAGAASIDTAALAAAVREIDQRAPRPWLTSAMPLLLLTALLLSATAVRAETAAESLQAAEAAFDQGLALAMDDADLAKGHYRDAALRFEQLASVHGITNGALYGNAGNAWYFAGDHGRALANYLRAVRYEPGNPLLLKNIAVVRSEVNDVLVYSWTARLALGVQRLARFLPSWPRLLLLAAVWGGCWWLLWRWRRERRIVAPRLLALALIVVVLLVASLLIGSRTVGVVIEPEVMARKGNSFIYEGAFESALHSGTEFELIEQRGDWQHIRLGNGDTAWLPAATTQLIN